MERKNARLNAELELLKEGRRLHYAKESSNGPTQPNAKSIAKSDASDEDGTKHDEGDNGDNAEIAVNDGTPANNGVRRYQFFAIIF